MVKLGILDSGLHSLCGPQSEFARQIDNKVMNSLIFNILDLVVLKINQNKFVSMNFIRI